MNKIILRTAIEGLVWTVVAFCYGMGIFSMCFPGTMAQFYDSVGNKDLSALYYGRIYDRTNTNENLYYALSKNILAHNDSSVVKYGDKWFALETDTRDKLASQIDAYLINSAVNDAEIQALEMYNTDFVLRRGYIVALINKGQKDKALDFLNNCPNENKFLLSASLANELGDV